MILGNIGLGRPKTLNPSIGPRLRSLRDVLVLIWQRSVGGFCELHLVLLLLLVINLDLRRCQSHLLHKVQVLVPAKGQPVLAKEQPVLANQAERAKFHSFTEA